MKVVLNIAEDQELRSYIKDLIRGQVKSIARKEIRSIIHEVFKAKIADASSNADVIVKEEVERYVRKSLTHGNKSWGSDYALVKDMARDEVNKIVRRLAEKGLI